DDLAELLAAFEPLVRGAYLLEREHHVDHRARAAACNELVGACEILPRSHRGAEDRELLPPDAVQRCGRVGPTRRAAHGDSAAGRRDLERRRPRRLADALDHDVGSTTAGRLLDGGLYVPGGVV